MSRSALIFLIVILLIIIGYLVYRGGYLRSITVVTIPQPTVIPTTPVAPTKLVSPLPTTGSATLTPTGKTISPTGY